ncbi:MAG: hypothetical protein ACKOXN_11685, partial [Limnohabitans sp.]
GALVGGGLGEVLPTQVHRATFDGHDMGFIKTISDIVTVLCDGAVLAQGTLDQVQADERVIEVYLGR